MRDAVPPCEMCYRGEAGAERRNRPRRPHRAQHPQRPTAPRGRLGRAVTADPAPQHPQRPHASHPGDALRRPRNNPPDEENPPEQTATTTFTPHVFKTTPEITFLGDQVPRGASQCTYRCVVLPDSKERRTVMKTVMSQCTYRCVVLPDQQGGNHEHRFCPRLNAPTGAWCSLTSRGATAQREEEVSMHLQVRGAP